MKPSIIPNLDVSVLCHYGCQQPALYLFGKKQTPQCSEDWKQCPISREKISKKVIELADKKSGLSFQERKVNDGKKRAERATNRISSKKNEAPPEGQLCDYGCNQLAQFRLRDKHAQYHWCCSKHYKQCPSACKESEEIRKKTSLLTYGVKHHMKLPVMVDKCKETSLERYGVSHAMKLPGFIEKKQQTEMSRYGNLRQSFKMRMKKLCEIHPNLTNFSQLEEVKRSIKEAISRKWGVGSWANNKKWVMIYQESHGRSHPNQDPLVTLRREQTCIKRYGVPYPSSLLETKNKFRATCQLRYGSNHPFQNPAFFHSFKRGSKYRYHPFTLPSGRVINLQGYEGLIVTELLDTYTEEELKFSIECPTFEYTTSDGKLHRYYPDIFIPKENLIVEVKSDYTFANQHATNMLKQKACLNAGYRFEFHVKSNKSSVTKIIN